MGNAIKSVGGFLGLSDGPKAPAGQFGNQSLDKLTSLGMNPSEATDAATGSNYATKQVQNNPILGQLFGNNGALSGALGKEQDLQKQGFQLTPDDKEAYGQASGDIARMFGQSENNLSQSLANRGLSAGPSGAAGASFSGLQGNKNEQLAKAQTNIANQRMQNTMQRIAQQQKFATDLGQQGASAINDQFGRQLSGSQHQRDTLAKSAGMTADQNNAQNQYGLQSAQYEQENKPANFGDMISSGIGSTLHNTFAAPGQMLSSIAGGGGGGSGGDSGGKAKIKPGESGGGAPKSVGSLFGV